MLTCLEYYLARGKRLADVDEGVGNDSDRDGMVLFENQAYEERIVT